MSTIMYIILNKECIKIYENKSWYAGIDDLEHVKHVGNMGIMSSEKMAFLKFSNEISLSLGS